MNMQTAGAGHAERGARRATWASRRLSAPSSGRSAARSGTAVFLSILFTRASSTIPTQLAKAKVALPPGSFSLNDTGSIGTLPTVIRRPILVGFSSAMDTVFLVGALVLVLAFICALFLREVPLRTMSAMQAAREQENASDISLAENSAADAGGDEVVGAVTGRPGDRSPDGGAAVPAAPSGPTYR